MNPSRPHLFGLLAGLFLAVGIAAASLIFANTWSRIAESQVINVTGSAHKNVRSDLAIWHASYSANGSSLLEAQEKLRSDGLAVTRFLRQHGISEITMLAPQIEELTAKQHHREDDTTVTLRVGYRLTQPIVVRSDNADGLAQVVGSCGEVLEQGVAFTSDNLAFIYTKAGDAKVEMMAEATRDARARAEQIASQGGRHVRQLRSAHMGVVQINPLYSAATSWEGNNDISTPEKTITATVSATFSLE